jgi:nitrogen fixation protein NifQ
MDHDTSHADREFIYSQLTLQQPRNPNHEWLACMVASWCVGDSILPDYLGLECHDFIALKTIYFADYPLPEHAPSSKQLDFSRMLERQDLINLLKNYSRPELVESGWIIGLLVAGCLGDDHLWHDLGLWSRSQLTALLNYNFPELATRNTHDMKWKKFLYKQLCEEEGLYLCRAPSCEVCVDYAKCFGSED